LETPSSLSVPKNPAAATFQTQSDQAARPSRSTGRQLKNGELNAHQTANLEKREANVQNREQRDMAKNGGHLTKAEQRGINRQQNRISKSIYKDKHE